MAPLSISRMLMFLSDGRFPLYFPANTMRWRSLSAKLEKVELGVKPELDFLFTVDVEYDYGSEGSGKSSHVLPFLKKLRPFLGQHGLKASLFVQGNMVEGIAQGLDELGAGHEVGLHGYAHEPWGTSWFAKRDAPKPDERKALLNKSLEAFSRASLPKPRSFRAPDMVIDSESLGALEQAGFSVDSSFPSYLGGAAIMRAEGKLLEVPVSVDPKPFFSRFRIAHYNVFNTYNVAMGRFTDGVANSAIRLAKLQKLYGQKPFLVFLCHPWEFFDAEPGMDKEKFGYASPGNMDALGRMIEDLEKSFSLNPLTMQEFGAYRNAGSPTAAK